MYRQIELASKKFVMAFRTNRRFKKVKRFFFGVFARIEYLLLLCCELDNV